MGVTDGSILTAAAAVVAAVIAAAASAASAWLDGNPANETWWRFWAPGRHRRVSRLVAGVHALVGAVGAAGLGAFGWSPFGEGLQAAVGNGLVYGLVAEALFRAEVRTFAGQSTTGFSLMRKFIATAERTLDREAVMAIDSYVQALPLVARWSLLHNLVEEVYGEHGTLHDQAWYTHLRASLDDHATVVQRALDGSGDLLEIAATGNQLRAAAAQLLAAQRLVIREYRDVTQARAALNAADASGDAGRDAPARRPAEAPPAPGGDQVREEQASGEHGGEQRAGGERAGGRREGARS